MAKDNPKVTLGGDWVKLKFTVDDMSKKEIKAFFKIFVTGANALRNTAIKSMQNTNRASWFYKRGSKVHHPSAPGSPPAIDTGDLIKSLIVDVRKDAVEFGATDAAPHGVLLEKGTKRMAARPWLNPAVEKEMPGIMTDVNNLIKEMIRKK